MFYFGDKGDEGLVVTIKINLHGSATNLLKEKAPDTDTGNKSSVGCLGL